MQFSCLLSTFCTSINVMVNLAFRHGFTVIVSFLSALSYDNVSGPAALRYTSPMFFNTPLRVCYSTFLRFLSSALRAFRLQYPSILLSLYQAQLFGLPERCSEVTPSPPLSSMPSSCNWEAIRGETSPHSKNTGWLKQSELLCCILQ